MFGCNSWPARAQHWGKYRAKSAPLRRRQRPDAGLLSSCNWRAKVQSDRPSLAAPCSWLNCAKLCNSNNTPLCSHIFQHKYPNAGQNPTIKANQWVIGEGFRRSFSVSAACSENSERKRCTIDSSPVPCTRNSRVRGNVFWIGHCRSVMALA